MGDPCEGQNLRIFYVFDRSMASHTSVSNGLVWAGRLRQACGPEYLSFAPFGPFTYFIQKAGFFPFFFSLKI